MNIVAIDILTVIIIIVFAAMGYKKGILKTVISVVGTLLAGLISTTLSKPIAQAIYNGGFKSTIVSKCESAMKLAAQEGTGYLDSFMKTMPKFVNNSLPGFGITGADLSAASSNGAAQIERLLAPVIVSFISVIVAAALFFVLFIVVKIVCAMIYNTLDDNDLGFLDGLAGGIIGIIEGFIIVIIAAFLIRIAIPHMSTVPEIISETSISESTVFKGVYESPLLSEFVSAVTDSPNA